MENVIDKKQDYWSWWCYRYWIHLSLCIAAVMTAVILCYSLAEYQLTPTDWLYGVLELLALLFFCIILPQEATKSRDTKFIFPTAGYYERFIGK